MSKIRKVDKNCYYWWRKLSDLLNDMIISKKCSEKMSLITLLKVKKNHGYTLSLENTIYEKRCQIDPPPFFLRLTGQKYVGI